MPKKVQKEMPPQKGVSRSANMIGKQNKKVRFIIPDKADIDLDNCNLDLS